MTTPIVESPAASELSGMGRDELLRRLLESYEVIRTLSLSVHQWAEQITTIEARLVEKDREAQEREKTARRVIFEQHAMVENLSAVQTRCTELLLALRASGVVEKMIARGPAHEPLVWQLLRLGRAVIDERSGDGDASLQSLEIDLAAFVNGRLSYESAPSVREREARMGILRDLARKILVSAFCAIYERGDDDDG